MSGMWGRGLSQQKEMKQTRNVTGIILKIKTPPLLNSKLESIWFAQQRKNGDLNPLKSEYSKGNRATLRGWLLPGAVVLENVWGKRTKETEHFQSQLQFACVSPSAITTPTMEQLNGVWKHEAGHQGDWFVSTEEVNPKPSSWRRRRCAGKGTERGCDSCTWPRRHTCVQATSHESMATLKKQPPLPLTTVSVGPLSLNVGRQVTPSRKRRNTGRNLWEWKTAGVCTHIESTARTVPRSEHTTFWRETQTCHLVLKEATGSTLIPQRPVL